MIRIFLLTGLIGLTSCAKHVHPEINYVVGQECHVSAKLLGCNSSEPPQCKREAAKFDRGCERIVVK